MRRPLLPLALLCLWSSACLAADLGRHRGGQRVHQDEDDDDAEDRAAEVQLDPADAAPAGRQGERGQDDFLAGHADGEGTLYGNAQCREEFDAALTLRRCLPLDQYRHNDLALVFCLTNVPAPSPPGAGVLMDPGASSLSRTCDNLVWNFKLSLSNNEEVVERVKRVCAPNLDVFRPCLEPETAGTVHGHPVTHHGRVLSCLIELSREEVALANNVVDDVGQHLSHVGLAEPCNNMLRQVEAVVFSDFRLMGDFLEHCNQDINNNECGRLKPPEDQGHSQGKVIDCLMTTVDTLSDKCQEEIYKVAEYQGADYHMDRSLYLACRNDRLNLCPKVRSGEGKVYKCLMTQKGNPAMSYACGDQLTRRQALMAKDYEVSRDVRVSCKSEIKQFKCRGEVTKGGLKHTRMAEILLCLEDALRNDKGTIGGECLFEMRDHRKMLMEDFMISPEIVAQCGWDIKRHCGRMERGGRTLHCLMGVAATVKDINGAGDLMDRCRAALQHLLKEADVASDWTVDPLLQQNCQDVVTAGCAGRTDGAGVMSCLMDLAATDSNHMTQECKVTVMEIAYFLARDFELNPKLYKKCQKDAQKYCGAGENWHEDRDGGGYVFSCLVRYLYVDEDEDPDGAIGELDDDCADQVEKTLERRAISVNLHPEVEDACREALIMRCSDNTGKGEEIQCLQDNFDVLDDGCREKITKYTKIESRNIHLNPAVMKACRKTLERHCHDVEEVKQTEGEVMHCLLEAKSNDPRALQQSEPKCHVVLEHWQILTMHDWHFSPQFKKVCAKDVRRFCPDPKTKANVLSCLSEVIQEDLLVEGRKPRVSGECSKELKFQLLQKHQEIKLNPKVKESCQAEIAKCEETEDGNPLECLKAMSHKEIGPKCKIALFRLEKEEVWQNRVDANLMSTCRNEIERHCPATTDPGGLIHCLRENMEDTDFDRKCRKVVTKRIIQQMKDYRLNPRLQKACQYDLPKFCQDEIMGADAERTFLEGRVIRCLRDRFVSEPNTLTESCRGEVELLLVKAAVDVAARPGLMDACPGSVAHCRNATGVAGEDAEDHGKVEECLKHLFLEKKLGHFRDSPVCIVEVAKLVETESVDVEIDVPLRDACGLDLAKFCRGVPSGGGRRISCLRDVMENKNLRLEPRCEDLLRDRLQMYLLALKENPIRSVQELYSTLNASPHRLNFLLMFLLVVMAIFSFGTVCGRVTKRAHYAKNK